MAPKLQDCKLAFIGGGNMAGAIIGGLLAKGTPKTNIHVAEPWDVNRNKMAELGVHVTTSNSEAALTADVVFLSVKPQVAKVVCQELGAAWSKEGSTKSAPLFISIAAGITMDTLRSWSSPAKPRVVRVMPNTPALLGEGASGVFAGEDVGAEERELVSTLLGSVSRTTEWVDKEELIDVVTGLSGSGPAYFFAMVEHLTEAGVSLGLSREQATRLAKQTCFGAGKMLMESSDEPAQLRKNVTSPNGTTEAALKSFEASGFKEIVDKAVRAATDRGEELGKTLGKL
ncbi:pyrroline-5-carboxylate reductase dimerization-domain-containing protein [Microdochium trichocladiopsis]|uniref:Pyrroline-5-carboxylate reductase n=1 Tax=Microdochium trichocladiopsis TaxID=1682393 RepID=A0A9P8YFL4_9PEZI|nr:pyrroline-5-carboxylate reductase dimerization-domain-containing protein [Microdochium trichocladiopsis]KAH7037089.1 pyrroline-5-carboxylate reductase dimerization-domain-containing protein [Microdochium trichocladiopsis]